MTNKEKATAYDEALERARKELGICGNLDCDAARQIFRFFPQLAESDNERIRRWILEKVQGYASSGIPCSNEIKMADKAIDYLEKQKDQKEELVYRLNGLMQDYIKKGKDDEEKEHRLKCYQLFWNALEDTNFFEQKEQQPTEWSEEDKAIVNCIVCCLDGQFVPEAARKQSLEWFNKHRRDFLNSHSWKPTVAQMEALRRAVNKLAKTDVADSVMLSIMYDNLKKL